MGITIPAPGAFSISRSINPDVRLDRVHRRAGIVLVTIEIRAILVAAAMVSGQRSIEDC